MKRRAAKEIAPEARVGGGTAQLDRRTISLCFQVEFSSRVVIFDRLAFYCIQWYPVEYQ
jgi:hypothetical protein